MNTFSSYPYAAMIAVVDVDIETGMIKIVRYCTVHDCGNMINPQIVDTQQQGSIMQGIGAALYEELRYDEEGQLLSSTFMDYRLAFGGGSAGAGVGAHHHAQSVYAVGRQRRRRDRDAGAAAGALQCGGRRVESLRRKDPRDAAHAGHGYWI